MTELQVKSVRVRGLFYLILSCCAIFTLPSKLQAQSITQTIPLDPGKIPDQIQQQNNLLNPTPETPQIKFDSNQIDEIIRFAITTTAVRYPFLANPSDRLTFSPSTFNPSDANNYSESDIRFAKKNPTIEKLTYGYFPRSEQFYWVLPDNRVIFETQGFQGGVLQQGSGTDITVSQTVTFTRALSGRQVVTTLPENFAEITKDINPSTFTIQSTSAEVFNPPGIPAPPIVLNTGINLNSPNVTVISAGVGSTNNSQGGGSNFGNLEPNNTPQVLQGFPTNNLQSLFGNGAIPIAVGSVIPEANLLPLGLSFNSPNNPNNTLGGTTSSPGLKILQLNRFDNQDLLQILTNPFLSRSDREFYYLNSLFWSDLGIRQPLVSTTQTQTTNSWQRIYLSRPVNQTLISYDPKEIRATYNNRFINLGVSVSYSNDTGKFNYQQSLNSTIGMLLGGTFLFADPQNLQGQVDQAKQLRDEKAKFTPLVTVATSEQRQQINQRLNSSLFYSTLGSSLEQVSGTLTFASNIAPTSSDVFQVRTGLYRRAVQFVGSEIGEVIKGDTTVSVARVSFENFGPLTFIGSNIPRNVTGIPANEAFASQVVLTAPDGRQFVQNINSSDPGLVAIPIGIKRAELAFDRIELTRRDRQTSKFFVYSGYVSLPSVELGWNGSNEGLNYGVTSGLWFNTAPNNAGNVENNTLGTSEPSVGVYANAFLTFNSTMVERDDKNNPLSVMTISPLLRLAWNSSPNSNNSSTYSLSCTFSRQIPGFSFSITPGVTVADQKTSYRTISFVQGSIDIGNGLRFRSSVEFDQNTFWSFEGTQQLTPNFTVGAFYKNFTDINQGIDTRETASNYGVSLRYQVPATPVSIETQLGSSDGNIEVRIKGNVRFQI
ncbi:hypothetical protein Syn7502_00821 [Synechococcus sp. PCC 7502]|uniref:hypothetical protein n=1 Tax=Synechococcus sp. PCC 7502 TaxID=1173263 RepID=UPI00029FB7F6|nr:hypothetical protein [Synechococcus sp. PCC 7502]AFY72953.1 hypothetical protein Syn7502_00821 [Synechococcus sp. PCC 7502]